MKTRTNTSSLRVATAAVSRTQRKWLWMVASFALVWIGKIYIATTVELLPEEAYYWTYSQFPATGYYDHPPMVAWLISLGTSLFGHTEFGVRFGTLLVSFGSLVLMFLLSRTWFGARCAVHSAALFNLIPIYIGTGLFAFPDGPLIFFWLLTLYFFSKVLKSGKPHLWLLSGISLGAALLSKYTAVLLVPGAFLVLAVSSQNRHWLWRFEPWLALLFSALVFSPVIYWNSQHEWASLLFQAGRTSGQNPEAFRHFLEFWLFQLGEMTPPLLGLLLTVAVLSIKRGGRTNRDSEVFAALFFWPGFFIFLISAFSTKVHINWTAPVYLSMLPLCVHCFLLGSKPLYHPGFQRYTGIATWVFCSLAAILMFSILVCGEPRFLARKQIGGWRQLTEQVQRTQENLQNKTGEIPFILGVDKLYYAAETGYYSRKPGNSVNWYALDQSGMAYTYWVKLKDFHGKPAVAILPNEYGLPVLKQYFNRIGEPIQFTVFSTGGRKRDVLLVECTGYRGSATNRDN